MKADSFNQRARLLQGEKINYLSNGEPMNCLFMLATCQPAIRVLGCPSLWKLLSLHNSDHL